MPGTIDFTNQAFAVEQLVTDTISYDVVRFTAQTITVRRRGRGNVSRRVNVGGNPHPVVYTETSHNRIAPLQMLRRRKDGTFRTSDGANPLYFTDEVPVEKTDYRF